MLTVSSEGFGKRTSAYDYRRTGRGGQGLIAHDLTKRGGRLVGSFPVEEGDELLLVSDQGQLIRVRVAQVRIAARNTQGVTIFRKAGTSTWSRSSGSKVPRPRTAKATKRPKRRPKADL